MADQKKMSAKQAAVAVLKRADGPLKVAEIVERVLATNGVSLQGKTPGATIAAILATENQKSKGLFRRTAPGTYALTAAAKAPASTGRLSQRRKTQRAPRRSATRTGASA